MSLLRRIVKWLGLLLAGAAALALAASGYIYISSERIIGRTYTVASTTIAVPTDSESIMTGRRLARTRGCITCHGVEAQGRVLVDEPLVVRLVAPNLTRVVRERSQVELEKIIRHGVYPDGRSTLGMPSSMFYLLSDEDLGMILAFLQSLPLSEGPRTEVRVGPLARLGLALGKYTPQAGLIDHRAARPPADPSHSVAYGRYLALTACTECHGLDLGGGESGPDLGIAAGYSDTAFVRLLQTGTALGNRQLGLMSEVAQSRFSHFTEVEIRALHHFLRARAAGSTPSGD